MKDSWRLALQECILKKEGWLKTREKEKYLETSNGRNAVKKFGILFSATWGCLKLQEAEIEEEEFDDDSFLVVVFVLHSFLFER